MAPTADGGWRVLWTDTDDRRQFIFYPGPTALPIEGTTAWLDWTNLGLPEAVAAGARIRNDDLLLPYSTSYGPAFEHDRMLSTYVVYGPDGMTMTDHGLIALDRDADRFVLGELVRLPSGNELPSSMEFAPLRQGTFGVSGTQAPAVDRPPDIVVWHVRDATRLLAALRSPSVRLPVPDLNAKLLTTSLVGASAIGGDRVLVVGRVIPVDATGPSETVERMYGAVLGCR